MCEGQGRVRGGGRNIYSRDPGIHVEERKRGIDGGQVCG